MRAPATTKNAITSATTMMRMLTILMMAVATAAPPPTCDEEGATIVTIDNFIVAESETYMDRYVKKGALGQFFHHRTMGSVDKKAGHPKWGQDVIRMNRDTLYSFAVLDLSRDAKVKLPAYEDRFVSLGMISAGHDVFPAVYRSGEYVITNNGCDCTPPCRKNSGIGVLGWRRHSMSCSATGTRYVMLVVRIQADASNDDDMSAAHAIQDAITVEQPGDTTLAWEPTNWNQSSLSRVHNTLCELQANAKLEGTFGFFSGPEKIDRLLGTMCVAYGWGGARSEDQTYLEWNPPDEDAQYALTVGEVPLEPSGFWSVVLYSKEGFLYDEAAHFQCSGTGCSGSKPKTILIGSCGSAGGAVTCLPTRPGWSMMVRFFRPGQAILDGDFEFPMPVAFSVSVKDTGNLAEE